MAKKRKPFSELPHEEKMARVSAAKRKAKAILEGPTRSPHRTERAKASKALKAAERVEDRLRKPSTPTKKKGFVARAAEGIKGLITAGKKAKKIGVKARGNIEYVERKSRGE